MPDQVALETDQVGFDLSFFGMKGRLGSQIDGGRKYFSIRPLGVAGVDPIGRKAFVLGLEIGGGKAKTHAATGSRSHGSIKRIRSAKHFGGVTQLSGRDAGTESASADPFPGKENWRGIIEPDVSVVAPMIEHGHIPGAVFAEPPVRTDRDGVERGKSFGQFAQEIGRLLAGARGVKRQSHHGSDLPPPEDAELVRQTGDQSRMFFRMKNGKGVVAKGEDGGVVGGVRSFSTENDPAVAEVKTVKKPESQVPDGLSDGGGEKGVEDGHVRRMREISGREIRWRAR